MRVGPLERTNLQTEHTQPMETDSYIRRTVEFPCNGDTCEAWLYMPKGIGGAKPPVVIMGHGMGGQKVSIFGNSSCSNTDACSSSSSSSNSGAANVLLCSRL